MDKEYAQMVGYPILSENIKGDEIKEYSTLTDAELKFIEKHKNKKKVLALAVLLKLFQNLNYFPTKISSTPKQFIRCIASQLGKNPKEIESYDKVPSLKHYHSKLILQYLNASSFEEKKDMAEKWFYEFASKTANHIDLFKSCVGKLIAEKVELPSLLAMERMVNNLLFKANQSCFEYINSSLTERQKLMIKNAIKESGKNRSELSVLKTLPGKPNIVTLHSQIKLLEKLRAFEFKKEVMLSIPVRKREWFAYQGREYNIRDMRRFADEKTYTIIACFIFKNYQQTIDNIISIFIKIIRRIHNRSQKRKESLAVKKIIKYSSKMEVLHDVTGIIVGYHDNARILRNNLIRYMPIEEYEQINAEVKRIVGKEIEYYGFLINYFSYTRRFSKVILKNLEFNSDRKNNHLLTYVDIIKSQAHIKKCPAPRPESLPKNWRACVFDRSGNYNWKNFELYVLSELSNALQSNDVWVKDSEEYCSINDYLMPMPEWENNHERYFKELGWTTDKEKFAIKLKALHQNSCNKFDKGIANNMNVRIKNNRLSITPLNRAFVPESATKLRKTVITTIPIVDIDDILVDVQNHLNFCKYFEHGGGKLKKLSKSTIARLLATIHSYGCNLGPSQSSKCTDYSDMQIINTKKFFLTELNLRKANNSIVNIYNRIPVSKRWGDGSSVSADGRLIRMNDRNLMSSWNPKYHGTGGMFYPHVSDKYIVIYSQFLNCGVYEADYVLDALYDEDNQIDLKPDTIHIDTHGQKEMLFGFCYLLGINLMPRIKNIGDCTLYKPGSKRYENINSLLKEKIDWKLIEDNLYEIMRLIASIGKGTVLPSFILKKLSTYGTSNKTYLALREIGRVCRTIYIFDYAGNKQKRRMVQAGCNKAELHHELEKYVSYGKGGELKARYFNDQRLFALALELVCNCITYWNALKIDEIVRQIVRDKKGRKSDADYISPLITQHINLYGYFDFDLEKKAKNQLQEESS